MTPTQEHLRILRWLAGGPIRRASWTVNGRDPGRRDPAERWNFMRITRATKRGEPTDDILIAADDARDFPTEWLTGFWDLSDAGRAVLAEHGGQS